MDLVKGLHSLLGRVVQPYIEKDGIVSYLGEAELQRIADYEKFWNFYLGYHFEDMPVEEDAPQIVQNWCRRFVDKYVSTEFNSGFTFKFDKSVEKEILPFLNNVWDDNDGSELMLNVGQCKDVTGDGYIHVHYESPQEIDDPFGMYPKGRIRLFSIPSNIVFPKYKDGYDSSQQAIESVSIIYTAERNPTLFEGKKQQVIKFVYTKDRIVKMVDNEVEIDMENPYKVIPIVHFKNLPVTGSNFGSSDLEDIIPLNIELNLKSANVSEILDYHAAPVTVVTGARIGQLERGADKTWGGLPTDAKVFNLELKGDLGSSNTYISNIKSAMFEIAKMPKLAIGGEAPPANLSGTAFQIAFMPLIDIIKTKQIMTAQSVIEVNKIITKIGITEGLLKPTTDDLFKLYNHRVVFGDILPRDLVQELNQLQSEFKLGLASRREAMERLGKDSIDNLLKEIKDDREENPIFYGSVPLSVPSGNRLVNIVNGEVILKPEEFAQEEPKANPQVELKNTTGMNREGEEKKVFSGLEKS